jgi:signal transduction histidine kinase
MRQVPFGKQNGTGLGLAMVSDIVEGHGGVITVESTVAGEKKNQPPGTAFYITAPASPPDVP